VTDFGFAVYATSRKFTMCGTPDYLAPEMVTSQGHGKGVDWWTLGIFIYEMLVGTTPFADSRGPSKIYDKIMQGKIHYPPELSEAVVDLLVGLLQPKPTHRLGVLSGGSQRIKYHRWFAGFDWNSLETLAMKPPYTKTIHGNDDLSNFDEYPADYTIEEYDGPDVGWDSEF